MVAGKAAPLKLAQTRLNMRTQRSASGKSRRGCEDNTDSPQHALIGEVTTILDNLQLLNDSLRQAEKVHKELVAGKAKLEYCVHVKTHSLLIDLTKCLPARKVYPMRLKGDWQSMLEQMQKEAEKSKKMQCQTDRSSNINYA